MVRRLNDSMRDAGSSGAACRVKTCGTAGGRKVKKHDRGHTVGRTKNKFEKKKRPSAAADGRQIIPQMGHLKVAATKATAPRV
jgi:hypothetical protein